jgi:Family of unknown function (DUF6314)
VEPDEDGRYHEAGGPPEAAVTAVRLPVPDAVAFLRGRWRVERRLTDHVTGTAGTFDGTAAFTGAGPGTLDYHEHGELRFGTHQGEASRRLVYRGRPDGTADVCFADGRDFYHLDPRPGRWQGQHPCGRDHYTLTAERLGTGTYREHWTVRGPDTDYEITTTLTRTGSDSMPT